MDDNRTVRPGNQGDSFDDDFVDALDDIFGVPDHAASEPVPEPRQQEPLPGVHPSPPVSQIPPAYSWPEQGMTATPPPTTGRTVTRVLMIGCAAIVALMILCFAILVVIGLVAGDPETSTTLVTISTT